MNVVATSTLRVMLVDDHAVVRAGYRRLIELEVEAVQVREFADGDAAYAALGQGGAESVDVLVLDLSMPGRSGLDLLRRVGARWPALRVLVFSMHDSAPMVAQALRAGAAGFVTKSADPTELLRCLLRVAAGEREVLSADIAGATGLLRAQPPQQVLSARELEVIQGLARGWSSEQLAEHLHLSPKTVSNVQSLVRQRLGLGSAVDLLRYAREHGLIDL